MSIHRLWRKRILLILSAVWYVLCILAIMGRFPIDAQSGWLAFVLRVVFLLLLLFFWTFACIDLQHVPAHKMLLWAAGLFILSALLFGGDDLLMMLLQKISSSSGLWSVVQWAETGTWRRVFVSCCLHLILIYTRRSKKTALHNSRSFSLWIYLREGSGAVMLLASASIASFLLVQFQKLPFSCTDLEEQSLVGVEFLGWVKNLFGIGGQNTQDIVDEWELDTAREARNTDVVSQNAWEETPQKPTLFSRFEQRRAWLLDQIVRDRKTVNEWVCTYMLTQINEKYQNPAFQYSVAALLTILLTPFLTLIWMTFQIVQLVLFRWLELLWIYRREPVLQRVEEMR